MELKLRFRRTDRGAQSALAPRIAAMPLLANSQDVNRVLGWPNPDAPAGNRVAWHGPLG